MQLFSQADGPHSRLLENPSSKLPVSRRYSIDYRVNGLGRPMEPMGQDQFVRQFWLKLRPTVLP